ncbi:hypothetical protein [Pedobacter metabolipauper]|uniref:Uncharacterized protein n=1 Tax=Pedobacter metabolipauper TaxID=425513 RepID=A0A4R6STU7_9SPHI|nr:hypothetical protein [Pedobacter metabolipauper]TDQ08807.1 hypothetical protein ATK78_3326 [Pedobacter metabolipauper]
MITKSLSILALSGSLILLSSFTPTNNDHPTQIESAATDNCDKIIKFTASKVRKTDGTEIPMKTTLTIFPKKKQIDLNSEDANGQKGGFSMTIESMECSINEKMDGGYAVYKCTIPQGDDTAKKMTFTLKIIDGKWTAKPSEGEQTESSVTIEFDSFETFKDAEKS